MADDIREFVIAFRKSFDIEDRPETILRRRRRTGKVEDDLVKLGWSAAENGRLTKLQHGKDGIVARAFWDPCSPPGWHEYKVLDIRIGGEYGGYRDRTWVPVTYAAERIDSMILYYLEKFESTWSFDPVK